MFARIALWSVALAAFISIACQAPARDRLDHMNVFTVGKRTYESSAKPVPEPAKPAAESASECYATIGDTLRISDAFNADVLTLRKRIDIDGTVLLPELGAVAVAGYTASELETLLRERWAPFFGKLDLHVVIESTGAQGVYFIYGEVGAPGEKRLLLDATVFEAVMAANPDAVKADLAHVRVFRGQATDGQVVDLALMRRTGDSSSNVAVQAFDVIFVPPTLAARLAGLFEGFRAWLREGVVPPPILIAGKEPQ